MARTGGEFHGDGAGVLALDMVGSQSMSPSRRARLRRVACRRLRVSITWLQLNATRNGLPPLLYCTVLYMDQW